MSKIFLALIAAILLAACASPAGKHDMQPGKDMMMHMKKMDINGDGMVTKDEFMKYHEAMYDSMKKNKDGAVDIKDMQVMREGGHMMDDKPPKN